MKKYLFLSTILGVILPISAYSSDIPQVQLSDNSQKVIASKFKQNLRWMYDKDMNYSKLSAGSVEKQTIDYVIDKFSSSIVECNGKTYIQSIQGSSLVLADHEGGGIIEVNSPFFGGSYYARNISTADSLNGKEYAGSIQLSINVKAIRPLSDATWSNGTPLSYPYEVEVKNGKLVDASPFDEDKLGHLQNYQPLSCNQISGQGQNQSNTNNASSNPVNNISKKIGGLQNLLKIISN